MIDGVVNRHPGSNNEDALCQQKTLLPLPLEGLLVPLDTCLTRVPGTYSLTAQDEMLSLQRTVCLSTTNLPRPPFASINVIYLGKCKARKLSSREN